MFEFVTTQTLGIISPPGSLYCYFFAVLSLFKVGLRVEVVVEIGRMNTVIIYVCLYRLLAPKTEKEGFTSPLYPPTHGTKLQSSSSIRM